MFLFCKGICLRPINLLLRLCLIAQAHIWVILEYQPRDHVVLMQALDEHLSRAQADEHRPHREDQHRKAGKHDLLSPVFSVHVPASLKIKVDERIVARTDADERRQQEHASSPDRLSVLEGTSLRKTLLHDWPYWRGQQTPEHKDRDAARQIYPERRIDEPRRSLTEHRGKVLPSRGQVLRAEKRPAAHNGQQCIGMRQWANLFGEVRQLFHEQQDEIEQAPAKERPVRTVPDASERPDDKEIADPAQFRDTVAAQGDVNIITEPGTERDMPTPPEFRCTARDIRIIKVLCKAEAEHLPQPDGHIAVTREIKVNLQGIGQHTEPGCRRRERHPRIEDIICHLCDIIRDQDLLAQSIDEAHHASRKIRHVLTAMCNLLRDEIIPHDWPRDELRKKRNVESHRQHTALCPRLAVVDIEKIRQELECEKRDSNRQSDGDDREVSMKQETELRCYEGQVLEYKEQADMKHNANRQCTSFACSRIRPLDTQADVPAHNNRQNHQPDKHWLTPSVEAQAGQKQKVIAEPP